MQRTFYTKIFTIVLAVIVPLSFCTEVAARPNATIKYSLIRAENPQNEKSVLILPYVFPLDSMGTTMGVGGGVKGYGQEQMLIGGTVYGSSDSAYGLILGVLDFKIPRTERFFFSAIGAIGYYPRQRAYSEKPNGYTGKRSGSNDSDKDDYLEFSGDDNWWEMQLEYVLPIGSMKTSGMGTYNLKNGMLVSGATGGDQWNPLKSGATVLILRQFNRYQAYETDDGIIDGTIHPLELGILYDNTDFQPNPSSGSCQYLAITQDFGWFESKDTWTFLEFEASKYFSFGETDLARQRVLALNFWTGNSPTWTTETDADGVTTISDRPPFLEGAKLGGFYRMRAYPNNRFNDKSVIYTTAEYRYIPRWNPIGEISWLHWLNMDWMQFVGFVEGGRVAPDYTANDLFSDWKVDAGIGFRAMMAGDVVRFDLAASDEGAAAWVMFGHPF